ncbi:MAG TPA: hypothetical protein VHH13_01535, partial [Arthrobacter sp.]|nr:hypothetical protein [Arthrobacter sp.]
GELDVVRCVVEQGLVFLVAELAGALVLEGTQIPPRSLVAGVPAKVRRELSDEEYQSVLDNAAHYVELAKLHRDANA